MFNLQTQILDLTDELELRKIREDELLRQQAMDSKHVIEEIEELRVSCLLCRHRNCNYKASCKVKKCLCSAVSNRIVSY